MIPEFTKTGVEHRVPLSAAALAAIDKAARIARDIGGDVAKSEYLFPNDRTGAALSENAMLAVLKRMGRKGAMTTHGCRATFRLGRKRRLISRGSFASCRSATKWARRWSALT